MIFYIIFIRDRDILLYNFILIELHLINYYYFIYDILFFIKYSSILSMFIYKKFVRIK
jgi:hypothetical protein